MGSAGWLALDISVAASLFTLVAFWCIRSLVRDVKDTFVEHLTADRMLRREELHEQKAERDLRERELHEQRRENDMRQQELERGF